MVLDNIAVTDIIDILTIKKNYKETNIMTDRTSYGISLCEGGEIIYTQDGKGYIENKNNAVILPQDANYKLYTRKSGLFYVVNFKCEQKITDEIISLPLTNMNECNEAFHKLKNDSLYEKSKTILLHDLYSLLRKMIDGSSVESSLSPALDYICKNFHSPTISNKLIAEKCNISEVYMRKLFSKRYHISPKQFIINLRISHAQQLLSEGRYNIMTVSEMCGFTNQYHFCRLFKEKTGYTPSAYMKRKCDLVL